MAVISSSGDTGFSSSLNAKELIYTIITLLQLLQETLTVVSPTTSACPYLSAFLLTTCPEVATVCQLPHPQSLSCLCRTNQGRGQGQDNSQFVPLVVGFVSTCWSTPAAPANTSHHWLEPSSPPQNPECFSAGVANAVPSRCCCPTTPVIPDWGCCSPTSSQVLALAILA